MRVSKRGAYAATVFAVYCSAIFATFYAMVRQMNTYSSAEGICFYRFAFVAAAMWIYCLAIPERRSEAKTAITHSHTLWMLLAMGFMRGLELLMWTYSLHHSSSFVVGVLGNLAPFMVAGMNFLFYRKFSGWKEWAAIGFSLMGAAVVVGTGGAGGASAETVAMMLASSFGSAAFLILSRRLRITMHAAVIMAYVFTISALFDLGICIARGVNLAPSDPSVWGLILIISFFCTFIAQVVPVWAVKYLGATTTAVLKLVGPVFSAFNALMFAGQTPYPHVFVGGVMMLIGMGIYIHLRDKRHAEQAAMEALIKKAPPVPPMEDGTADAN